MQFSIVTPSFNQLDWLRLCAASIRDQAAAEDGGMMDSELLILSSDPTSNIQHPQLLNALGVEHIIQDAGTPGIEDFARQAGTDLHRERVLASTKDRRLKIEDRDAPAKTSLPSPISHLPSPTPHLRSPISDLPSPTSPYRLAIFCESDAGMYDAINRGLRKSAGEICAYLNCDEQYLPGALAAVAGQFEAHPELDILFADAVVVDADGRYICHRKAQAPFRDQLWFRMPVLTCATFFRRRVFEEHGVWFDETKKVCGDVIWLMRAQEKGLRMAVLRRFTSVFTDAGEALGLGSKADSEFLELRERTPGRVKRFLPLYLAYHRLRSVLSGVYSQRPFDYALYTRESPQARLLHRVDRPTQVWKSRLEIDRKAIENEPTSDHR